MRLLAIVLCVFPAIPAAAQSTSSTYVSASLAVDVVRSARVDVEDSAGPLRSAFDSSTDGEAPGFAVNIGRTLGIRWGVELEVARSGEIEHRRMQRIGAVPIDSIGPPGFDVPRFEYEQRIAQQRTTIGTLVWVRQDLGARVALAFLGGVSFSRIRTESEIRLTDRRLAIWLPFPQEITAIEHRVGPSAGVDAQVHIAGHVAATAGLRLHGAGQSTWLIRPSAGLRWMF